MQLNAYRGQIDEKQSNRRTRRSLPNRNLRGTKPEVA